MTFTAILGTGFSVEVFPHCCTVPGSVCSSLLEPLVGKLPPLKKLTSTARKRLERETKGKQMRVIKTTVSIISTDALQFGFTLPPRFLFGAALP